MSAATDAMTDRPRSPDSAPGEVTVICQVFHPDAQSTSQLLSGVLADVAASGHRVTVWSGYPGLHGGTPPANRETWRGLEIRRMGWRASVKKSAVSRALSYLSFTLAVWLRLVFGRGGRHVLAVTNPPFMPVVVWLASVLRGHRCKYMLQDIYPEGLTAVGRLRSGSFVDCLWHALNRRAFAAAVDVWVLGRDMAALVQNDYGVPASRIRIVPHWSPVEEPVRPAGETRLWARLGFGERFVVQYSGNMGLWHDLDTIVRAAARLRERDDIRFLFIGAGMRQAAAEALARELSLTNVTWLPYQDRENLSDALACCDVALISQRAGLSGVAVPCKLYGILAAGRAIVAQVPADSEVALTVTEEACGVVVAPGDAAALVDRITALAGDRTSVQRMGARARAGYEAHYTQAHGAAAFAAGLTSWPR